jgi:hypothetical protein
VPVQIRLGGLTERILTLTEAPERACKCCSAPFSSSNEQLEFCSSTCVDTYFRVLEEELLEQKRSQISALQGLSRACLVCGNQIQALTKRHTTKQYCSSGCVLKGMSRTTKIIRPCVHCDVDVLVPRNMRPDFVRCPKHQSLWPKVRLESAQNMKRTKAAQAPFDQYLLKGPWWDHKKRAWTVLLMHSGASSKREMEYARYLLSVKEGSRLSDATPVIYVDGDRTNVEVSNLALG